MKSLVFIFGFFGMILFHQGVCSQPTPSQLAPIREDLLYEVHYGPFRLGFIEIQPIIDTTYMDIPAMKYKIIMRSNPRLFFLGDKLEHYYSVFAIYEDKSYGLFYKSDDLDSKIMSENVMTVDTIQKVVTVEFKPDKDDYIKRELPWVPYSLLGPDIFYFTRFFAGKDTLVNSPIYVDTTLQEISLKFENHGELKKYPVFSDSIKTYKMFGDAPFTGPFGFNGKFTAWFASDSLRIPLEAHVDVWIGSVKVKLIGYKRFDALPQYQPQNRD